MQKHEEVIAGIDLGTRTSTLAMLDDQGIAVPMKNSEGQFATPSNALFQPGQPPIVGQEAVNAAPLYAQYFASEMKLHVGEKDSQGHDVAMVVTAEGVPHTAVQCQGLVAARLIADANAQSSRPITAVVVAVPPCYRDNERQTVLTIANQIGCKILGLIDEPVAVAHAYIQAAKDSIEGMVLIFDMGHGTTDLTLLETDGSAHRIHGTNGKPNLGGRRLDMALIEVIRATARASGIDIDAVTDPSALHEFRDKVMRAKHTLTQAEKAPFYVNLEGHVLKTELTRREFEEASAPIIEEIKTLIAETLAKPKLTPSEIKAVLLNGPSTQTPMVLELLKTALPGVPVLRHVDPVTAVSQGAALAAAKFAQQDGHDAISKAGAKLRALSDSAVPPAVSTHALGCESLEGHGLATKVFTVIIPANSRLPATKSERFCTVKENQTSVEVRIFQGQDASTPLDQCQYVETVLLDGIAPGHLNSNRIEVEYAYNRSGIVEVTVKDLISGKSVSSSVSHNLGNC